jgi:hypothetical protein
VGVFLRWGVFGILAVAALLYAYNASKRLSEGRASSIPVVAPQSDGQDGELADAQVGETPEADEESAEEPESEREMSAACEKERLVAERALKMRRDGEPLDRLLRIDVIAFEADEHRRARLETVARQWFEREGRDPDSRALRREVQRDCQRVSPAP